MAFGLKEAFEYYIKTGQTGELSVHVDDFPEVVGICKRSGCIVPMLQPGAKLTAEQIMERAGISQHERPKRNRASILSPFKIIVIGNPRHGSHRLLQ